MFREQTSSIDKEDASATSWKRLSTTSAKATRWSCQARPVGEIGGRSAGHRRRIKAKQARLKILAMTSTPGCPPAG